MHRFRSLTKRVIAYVLYFSGALWLYAEHSLRNRAVVLMYHRVLPKGSDSFSDDGIVVTPETFAANMRFLRRYFAPLSAADFGHCLEQGRFPRRACMVTFDDGWQDNVDHALPILKSEGVPAAIFVATGYIGTDSTFWQERMTRRLYGLSRDPGQARKILDDLGIAKACDEGNELARRTLREFVTGLKAKGPAEIERVTRLLDGCPEQAEVRASGYGNDRFLSWESVRELTSGGLVSIGSHAHSHVPLTQLGLQKARAELLLSIREIETHGVPAPRLCAYPNGDYDEDVVESVKSAGLVLAFTTEPGRVAPGSDPYRLPRVNVHETAASTPPQFLCRLLGLF